MIKLKSCKAEEWDQVEDIMDFTEPEEYMNKDSIDKSEYHTKCHDCGRFLKKERWVKKDHPWKEHGLCAECESDYDDPNDR